MTSDWRTSTEGRRRKYYAITAKVRAAHAEHQRQLGDVDQLTREFAREHSGRLWKQLVLSVPAERERPSTGHCEALLFAVAAAVAIQIARLAAGWPGDETSWLLRNVTLLLFPFLAGYFIVQRQLPFRQIAVTLAPFVLAGL